MGIALVALVVLAQAAIGSTAAFMAVTVAGPNYPRMPQRGAAKPAMVASMRQTALSQARAWRSDALLIEEVSWLSWPTPAASSSTSAPVNGWSTFVFASGGDRLSVVVDRGSGFILGQHLKTIGLPATRALDPSSLAISAETASATAELAGGRAYRAVCPDHRNMSKVGASLDSPNGQPIWAVTYADDRSSSNPDVTVIINAVTGQVVQKTISMPSCDKS